MTKRDTVIVRTALIVKMLLRRQPMANDIARDAADEMVGVFGREIDAFTDALKAGDK